MVSEQIQSTKLRLPHPIILDEGTNPHGGCAVNESAGVHGEVDGDDE